MLITGVRITQMKNQDTWVLQFAEMGGDAQIGVMLQQSGIPFRACNRLREALKSLRNTPPQLVIADYHYQHNFSMQRSNLDALFAIMERLSPRPALILLSLAEDRLHLQRALEGPLGSLHPDILEIPLSEAALSIVKQRLNTCRH